MDSAAASPPPQSLPPPPRPSMPVREDCWSEEATSTLVDAWGSRYLELNRGNLRQKQWQEVADSVNARHGHIKKNRRTDVQCKNRIDTLKKKYKVEKYRVSTSNGSYTSTWPFYSRLDVLIGSIVPAKSPAPVMAVPIPIRKVTPVMSRAMVVKRKMPAVDDSFFRRNYSAVAAAAAAAETESEDDLEVSRSSGESGEKDDDSEGIRRLARAIGRFGEIYERVEREKQRQMVDLEKQRMQFTKDLEFQRMQMFMDTQVQLEKIKRTKRTGSSDTYS